ncbi:VanZ family protein [Paenibacillus aquistagni]|uniref:VanZ family protein n=1 Tax=Paenibacillus aquistagni TaxID=1852522 RepID=UPI00145A2CA8|nr:VanZ family protein [Paenibacillus aquistagni]NMM54296.1 VanZ family protein [Paenibacillus aquistagni]
MNRSPWWIRALKAWLPVVILCGIIFYSSSQPANEQDVKPTLAGMISEESLSWFPSMEFYYGRQLVSTDDGMYAFLEFWLRKGAHFATFGVLGLLFLRAWRKYTHLEIASIAALLCTFLYAASDEWHQSFVVNRTGRIADVVLDTTGALFFIVIACLLIRRRERKRQPYIWNIK